MPRNPCTFSKSDVRRAILAVADAGLCVARVEFRPDVILLHTERSTALPTLAGAVGVSERRSGGRSKRSCVAEDTQSASPAA
jgi:hypothetical protein